MLKKWQKNDQLLSTTSYNVIYIWSKPGIDDYCKIGMTSVDASIKTSELFDNSDILKSASIKRIDSQTKTASVKYILNFCTLAIRKQPTNKKNSISFTDKNFHKVLEKNGFKKSSPEKTETGENIGDEWFHIKPEKGISFLNQYKNGSLILFDESKNIIRFRPEQIQAIQKTAENYSNSIKNKSEGKMLWNAIMRFGKTLTSYGFVNSVNSKENIIKKVLILTHRPDVNKSWFDDYQKYFINNSIKNKIHYQYGSKNKEYGIDWKDIDKKNNFFFFISIQDLRGKESVDNSSFVSEQEIQKFKESNKDFFDTEWDLIIVDEAHEGNTTDLANEMHSRLKRKFTLYLSGTPFKLLSYNKRVMFQKGEIFDWGYIEEQKAKSEWAIQKREINNPYSHLPSIKINCIKLHKNLNDVLKYDKKIEEGGFNFAIFFQVGDNGKFIHEKDIDAWLNNMCTEDDRDTENLKTMPYSAINRDFNNHSMWYLPGVKEAAALEEKLRKHFFFKNFKIINAAGGNVGGSKLLDKLFSIIRETPNKTPLDTRTITLTCGRLTTGVTVPEWTTVLMLSNTTSAQTYFQTTFRCKTPWEYMGRIKTQGVVYDFAPTRILEVMSEYANVVSLKAMGKQDTKKTHAVIKDLLNYLPMVSFEGNCFKTMDATKIMEAIKKHYSINIVRNGFNTIDVLNNEFIKSLPLDKLIYFSQRISLGHSKNRRQTNQQISEIINTNNEGTPEFSVDDNGNIILAKSENNADLSIKQKVNLLSPEEKEKMRAIRELQAAALKVTVRVPLMVFALDPKITDDFKLRKFPEYFDNEDWNEFMEEISKEKFIEMVDNYLDIDAIQGAVKMVCRQMDEASRLQNFTDRVAAIVEIFNRHKNPDKETVFTPWYVVDIHYKNLQLNWKRILSSNKGVVTIVDINSKSGLYPLYCLQSLWNYYDGKKDPIWILKKHLYVNCRTDAARKITRRILGIAETKYDSWANKHVITYDIYKTYNSLLNKINSIK